MGSGTIVQILVGVGFLAYSIFKIWKTIEFFRRRSASQAWPIATGEVTSKKVSEHWNRRSGKSYYPEITYKYSVIGQLFEKQTKLVGFFTRKSAEKAINNIGANIELHYNPENPKEHISEQDKVNILDMLLTAFILALGVFDLYLALI
jgi:hypothetical protein